MIKPPKKAIFAAPLIREILNESSYDFRLTNGMIANRLVLDHQISLSGLQIREAIHHLRVVDKIPIGSSTHGGYWLARQKSDLTQTIEHIEGRILVMQRVVNRLREAFPGPAQMAMFDKEKPDD